MTDILLHLICATAALHAAMLLRRLEKVRVYCYSFAFTSSGFALANLHFNIFVTLPAALSVAAAYYLVLPYLQDKKEDDSKSKIRRGAAIADASDVAKMLKDKSHDSTSAEYRSPSRSRPGVFFLQVAQALENHKH
jgi:hypothetical protein